MVWQLAKLHDWDWDGDWDGDWDYWDYWDWDWDYWDWRDWILAHGSTYLPVVPKAKGGTSRWSPSQPLYS